MYEFALLALPLLRACAPSRAKSRAGEGRIRPLRLACGTLVLLLPWLWLHTMFANPPKYPFSRRGLPVGISRFLNHVGASGRVLNFPSTGGYLEWTLYPQCKIFVDLDAPFFFTDDDVFTSKHMYRDPDVLRKVLATYQPAFLSVPITLRDFPQVIRNFPRYVPVFFDDAEVLYVDERHDPSIAARYRLRALDPYVLFEQGPSPLLRRADRSAMLSEATRLLEIDAEGLLTHQLLSVMSLEEGAYDRALSHATAIIKEFPELAVGYGLQADALQQVGTFERAIASYRLALRRASPGHEAEIYRQMGYTYMAAGQYQRAYSVLRKGVDPFAPEVSYGELYRLAESALHSGHVREAAVLFTFARAKAPAAGAGRSPSQ